MSLTDAMHWRLCADQMRIAAEAMLSEECRAIALRLAEDYDRLARQARARHDGGLGNGVKPELPREVTIRREVIRAGNICAW